MDRESRNAPAIARRTPIAVGDELTQLCNGSLVRPAHIIERFVSGDRCRGQDVVRELFVSSASKALHLKDSSKG